MTNELFRSIILEKEQEGLLTVLVEASRNVPRDRRQKFIAVQTLGRTLAIVSHPGLPKDFEGAYIGDLEILAQQGLLNLAYSRHGVNFDVTPLGIRYYEWLKKKQGMPMEQIEQKVRVYLNAKTFQRKYPEAFEKWREAESLFWEADTTQKLTVIGHLCREAMQEFVTSLVERIQPPDVAKDKARTIARLKAVLASIPHLGSTEHSFLQALVAYWGTVSDLVQRQEHGAQREKESLLWEDGRRVVFYTMLVMYEVDRVVERQ